MEGSSKSRVIVLVAIAAVLAVAVLFALVRRQSEEAGEVSADAQTLYVCTEDGHSFTLTPAQFAEQSAGAPPTGEMERGQLPRAKCPQCGQRTAVLGIRCPKDQTPIGTQTRDGQPPRCPQCGVNPLESASR